MARKARTAGTFGTVENLPSGRHRARYRGPDGRRYTAPRLFLTKQDARGWLSLRQAEIIRKAWTPPEADAAAGAQADVRDLRRHAGSTDSATSRTAPASTTASCSTSTSSPDVRPAADRLDHRRRCARLARQDGQRARRRCAPTPTGCCARSWAPRPATARSTLNPCVIRGAGKRQARPQDPASVTRRNRGHRRRDARAVPRRWCCSPSWCALRFGELTELRRRDVVIVTEAVDAANRRAERTALFASSAPSCAPTTASKSPHPRVRRRHPRRRHPAAPAARRSRSTSTRFVGRERDALLFPAAARRAPGPGHAVPPVLHRARDGRARPISAGMTSATAAPCSPPRPVPRSPN